MTRPRRLRPRQREAGRDRRLRPGGSASPSPDENPEDSKLRRLAFMALAADTLKPGSSMAESRIRRFQDQALRALASQVAEADGSEDDNLQRLAFLALASQVLKPGDADTESRIRQFQDQALLAPDSPTPNSENPSTNDQGPQNEESMAPDSQSRSDNGPNTRDRDSRTRSSDPQPREALDDESESENPRSAYWHEYHRKRIMCQKNIKPSKRLPDDYIAAHYEFLAQLSSEDESPWEPEIDTRVCANCGESGHGVDMCMIPREDGYVHGCVFCNTIDHDTIRCAKYTWDFDSQVRVLVRERGNMPPLKDGEWHEITQEYIHRSLIWFEEGFPWTPEFGQMVLKTPELLEKAREGIEYPGERPVDPKTRSWAAIEDTIEGGSGKFEGKLMDIGWI